jgi:hypothetical protein
MAMTTSAIALDLVMAGMKNSLSSGGLRWCRSRAAWTGTGLPLYAKSTCVHDTRAGARELQTPVWHSRPPPLHAIVTAACPEDGVTKECAI